MTNETMPLPEKDKNILAWVLIAIGIIFIVIMASFAWQYGFLQKEPPKGNRPTNPTTGEAIDPVDIYVQASLEWRKFASSAAYGLVGGLVGGIVGLFDPNANHLVITNIQARQTTPYTLALMPLFLGSGDIECTAELIDPKQGNAVIWSDTSNVAPFGGLTQKSTARTALLLQGYPHTKYKISIACTNLDTQEQVTKARDYTVI